MTSGLVVFLVLRVAASAVTGADTDVSESAAGEAAAPDEDAGATEEEASDEDGGPDGGAAAGEDTADEDAAPVDEPAPLATEEERAAAEALLDDAPLAVHADERAAAEALLDDAPLAVGEETPEPATATAAESLPPNPPSTTPDAPRDAASDAPRDAPSDAPPDEFETVQWEDADTRLPQFARGALGACEAIIFPITFLPLIGELATAVSEWFCLVPAALTVDYLGTFHGGRGTSFWQPLTALFLAKLWRDAALITGFGVGLSAVLAFSTVFGVASALVLLSPGDAARDGAAYLPTIGLTGLLTVVGLSVVATQWAQDTGGDIVFEQVYFRLSDDKRHPDAVAAARERAFLRPPPDPYSRAYSLLVATVASEPAGDWRHAIPVAGPLFRAGATAEAVEADIRSFGRDVLHEEPQHPEALTELARTTSYVEGVLNAGGQALLLLGGAAFVTGLVAAPVVFSASGDAGQYAVIGAGLGTSAALVAGSGLFLLLLAEIPRITRNLSIPLAFGALSPADANAE